MNGWRRLILCVVVVVLVDAAPLLAQQNLAPLAASALPPSTPLAYALRISAGDLLDVNVFDTPELTTKVRVNEGGTVTLPLGGVLSVSGLTADEAARATEARLRER